MFSISPFKLLNKYLYSFFSPLIFSNSTFIPYIIYYFYFNLLFNYFNLFDLISYSKSLFTNFLILYNTYYSFIFIPFSLKHYTIFFSCILQLFINSLLLFISPFNTSIYSLHLIISPSFTFYCNINLFL
jgi:hypothetical protein